MSHDHRVANAELPTAVAQGLFCTLPAEQLPRRAIDTVSLFERAIVRRPLDDGTELTFSGSDDTARELLAFVLAERRCCATLSFELAFVPDHSTIVLRLRGRGKPILQWTGATR